MEHFMAENVRSQNEPAKTKKEEEFAKTVKAGLGLLAILAGIAILLSAILDILLLYWMLSPEQKAEFGWRYAVAGFTVSVLANLAAAGIIYLIAFWITRGWRDRESRVRAAAL